MYNLKVKEEYYSEFKDVVRAFYPDGYECAGFDVSFEILPGTDVVTVADKKYEFSNVVKGETAKKRLRRMKTELYDAMSDFTGRSLPWGALTGIRPTKLGYELLGEGTAIDGIADHLRKVYRVSDRKAGLTQEVVSAQRGFLERDGKYVNVYVHIPFCVSRCNYCSFVTLPTEKYKSVIPLYVDKLKEEIGATYDLLENCGKKVYSVYIGGGTPTAVDAKSLGEILSTVRDRGREFTVEAGRPDTIDREKLAVMKDNGVTRVCVNPQTLNGETLMRLGRNHTPEQFFVAYDLTKSFGFDVNVDLIMGLDGEDPRIFCDTLDKVIRLKPENITVHALSRKRGSELFARPFDENAYTADMNVESYKWLTGAGYIPYYLYRQKNTAGNLENAGYCLPSKQCVNNISVMEETLSVVACGAGAITKTVTQGGQRIERLANLRDVKLYLEQFDERLTKKSIFLKNQFTSEI